MRNRRLVLALALGMTTLAASAQEEKTDKNLLNHADLGVTLGTTGYGLDLAMPVTDWARIRTGLTYVPKMEVPMTFGIQVGDDAATSDEKFNRLAGYLTQFTGNEVSPEVEMTGRPNFWNWSVLVDVFPLKNNRHWHVTAGFFLGSSKVAEAYNSTESMSTLVAMNIYNRMYDKLHGKTRRELRDVKIIDIPGIDVGNDPEMLVKLQEKFDANGRMGVHLGNYNRDITDDNGNVIHQEGDAYIMTPNADNMVKADMKVNPFKPYIGVGYDGRLSKRDERLRIGFDAGIMLWGGTPSLITHDGTDMINDVEGIKGKVGDYVSAMEKMKAFPLLNLRLSYKLF